MSAVTTSDITEADEIVLEEVGVVDLVAKDVKAIAYHLLRPGGVEAILEISFQRTSRPPQIITKAS